MGSRAHDGHPYRIEVDGGPVIRCWDPRDAPLLKEAVDSSLEHLRRWMPWAHDEPQELAAKAALLRQFRGIFDLGQDFVYGIFSPDEARVPRRHRAAHPGGEGAFEIGYWVRADAVRQGIATSVAAALTRVGIEFGGADRIEIRVDVDNELSCRIPRRLGYREEGVFVAACRRTRLAAARRRRLLAVRRGSGRRHRLRVVQLTVFDCRGLPPRVGGAPAACATSRRYAIITLSPPTARRRASESSSTRAIWAAFRSKTSPNGKKL